MKRFIVFILFLSFPALASPVSVFVANEGQWEGDFGYLCRVGNADYYVTPTGMTIDFRQYDTPAGEAMRRPEAGGASRTGDAHAKAYGYDIPMSVRGHVLKLIFIPSAVGAPHAAPVSSRSARLDASELEGQGKLPSYSNYFIGRDTSRWRSRVRHYERVVARQVWPGIDVEYHADSRGVETLFRVQPGADVGQIQVEYRGLEAPLSVDSKGRLVLQTSLGPVYEEAPFSFQREGRRQRDVPISYCITADNSYSFTVSDADPDQELVIDPLIYSTHFPSNELRNLVSDADGNKIFSGVTHHASFPVTPGAYQTEPEPGNGRFLTKLSPDADSVLFSTFFPGGGPILEVDPNTQSIWYLGYSEEWPLTPDAFDMPDGGICLAHLSPDGTTLEFGSRLGGSDIDFLWAATVDSVGLLYLCGYTSSPDFPVTPDALFPDHVPGRCPFLTVIDPQIPEIAYSTFLPGDPGTTEATKLALFRPGLIWLGGWTTAGGLPTTPDAMDPAFTGEASEFMALIDTETPALRYCSYFGNQERLSSIDVIVEFLPVDTNRVWFAGLTYTPGFTLPPGGFDTEPPDGVSKGFLLEFELPDVIHRGTFLGGSDSELIRYASRLPDGSFVVAGPTRSDDFPVTANGYDTTHAPGEASAGYDVFLCRLTEDVSDLRYGTFIGGGDYDTPRAMVCEGPEAVWLSGGTHSFDYPVTPDAIYPQYADNFITKMSVITSSATDPRTNLVPETIALSIYPNPFNAATTFAFTLSRSSPVVVTVYNVLGQGVYNANLGRLGAGSHRHIWDASGLPSGMYVSTLETATANVCRKVVVLR